MITQDAEEFNPAKYAEGVFIALTGGTVHDFAPFDKQAGFRDALGSMPTKEKAWWLEYCLVHLGYLFPEACSLDWLEEEFP